MDSPVKSYFKWIFTRWYYWLVVIIDFIFYNTKAEVQYLTQYLISFLGSLFSAFLIVSGFRLFFWILGKIFVNRRKD